MRLDQLEARFGDQISVEWRSFLLRPRSEERDLAKFVDYTRSWQRPAEMEPTADFTTPWASDEPAPRGSLPAHLGMKTLAGMAPDAARAYHHALLAAYFTDNRDISDPATLAALAGDVGVDPGEFATMLDEQSASLTDVVLAEHNSAIEQGVTAVPTVVIDEILPVPGAQDVESYAVWIQRLIDRRLGGS